MIMFAKPKNTRREELYNELDNGGRVRFPVWQKFSSFDEFDSLVRVGLVLVIVNRYFRRIQPTRRGRKDD